MLNNIESESLINSSQLRQSQNLQTVDSTKDSKNPYKTAGSLVDQTNISDEALKLFERDQEVEKYKNILFDQVTEEEANKEVASLIQRGILDISNEELADSMLMDEDLLNSIF